MRTIEVTLVPPIISTVDADSFLTGYPFEYSQRLVIIPNGLSEEEKAKKLQRSSDFIIFTFNCDDPIIDDVCHEIAKRIISRKGNKSVIILVVDEVISLEGMDVKNLSSKIHSVAV